MEEKNTPRYTVATNGSKSYYQVTDTRPAKSWESDICTVWGKKEKADRIAKGLNLLESLDSLSESSTKAQIMEVIKEYLP